MSASKRPRDTQRVSPHDDEEEAPTSDPTPSVPQDRWTLPGVATRGGGRSGGSGDDGSGDGRGVIQGPSRQFMEQREKQESFRRVKPVQTSDESVDPGEQGVHVPTVGVPETVHDRPIVEPAAAKEEVEAISTGGGGGGGVGEGGDEEVDVLVSTRSERGSPSTASRNQYVAEQLKQLSEIVRQSSRTVADAGAVPPHQLPSPARAGAGTGPPAGAPASPSHVDPIAAGAYPAVGATATAEATIQPTRMAATAGQPLSPLSRCLASVGSTSPDVITPTSAGAPGIPTAEGGPVSRGLELESPSGSSLSSLAGIPSAVTPLHSSVSGEDSSQQQQRAAIGSFVVGQLEQLSELLVADPRGGIDARAAGGGEDSSSGESLRYSMSMESSLSSPFSPFAAAAAWGSGHSSRRGDGSEASVSTKTPPSPHVASLMAPAPAPAPAQVPAPFEGSSFDLRGVATGSVGHAERSGTSPGRVFSGFDRRTGGSVSISSSSSSSSSSSRSRSSSSSNSSSSSGSSKSSRSRKSEEVPRLGDGGASVSLEGRSVASSGWTPAVDSPEITEEGSVSVLGDDARRRDDEATLEGSAEDSRGSSSSRRAKFVRAFGRVNVWRQMLEVEPRVSPALRTIEGENRAVLDQSVVLPCAPSDEEKVLYHKTGRVFLVSAGIFSLAALSAGLWLFTIAAPYFYWFGVPTTFLMIYLLFSYFGVAVWGKDFDPEEHEKAVQRAREGRYFPTVDVFLPVCNEPTHLLANTWKHVGALDYPFVTVHVLDDGGKEEVRQLAALHGFNYIRRENRTELRKAGNLRYAFARTSGEFLAIFDADFCPRPEFLRETTPYFADGDLAILQTPQYFRRREEQTWVERGAGVTQELFYRMVQVNRNKFDAAICVGTCGVYRRSALAPFGGTAAIAYSEDVHTGFNCTRLGYKVKYIPHVMAMGTCPPEPRALFMQQYRWCMGSTTLLCNAEFWRSNLTIRQKLCYFSGMLYYAATAMSVFVGPLPAMLLIWFKPSAVLWFNIAFSVPSILFSFVAMRVWARQTFDLSCHRVKIIQSFSHLYAIRDRIMNQTAPWIPTGGGASSRYSSGAYDSSVKLMLYWTTACTIVTIAGTSWRVTQFPWYHFLPSVALTLFNFGLHISTLL